MMTPRRRDIMPGVLSRRPGWRVEQWPSGEPERTQEMESVLLPSSSPIVTVRILFRIGSALDPEGREGVAALAAAVVSRGGSRPMSYEEIVKAMYPMATAFRSQVDKEMTVFAGQTHVDNLHGYYETVRDMLLNPGWRSDDFKRLRENAINYLKVSLRGNNDEELAKERLYNFIYEERPYGHENTGTVESLEGITLDDVKEFCQTCYRKANLLIGIAGGYPDDFPSRVECDFGTSLPTGIDPLLVFPQPKKINGLEMQVIEKETRGTAISLGFPIPVTRSHPDWP